MSELIGRKLGKYILEAKLGEGGMAAVFQAHHPQFDRPVAIKILPPTIGQDPSFQARFEREARTIAGLNHPNIIRIYDVDQADGLFYMVTDLLPGGTLEGRLREGGLDRKWSTDVIVKMAEALEYAHARGVIHRDIKPSNILLDADGQPVLADFGIAKLVQGDGDANLTAAGMVMGTPAYMAPEQLTGGQPDARSDIYSLGVVLYQLLAGRAPFTGDTMAVVSAHLTKPPPPLRDYVPDLPPALEAVVLQALSKQPEHRFKSAGVFSQALRNAAQDLEPGLVRIASAVHDLVAPTFSGAALPPATGAIAGPRAPLTIGQQVTRYMPIVLGVMGLLLLISIILKYWAIVTLLAILIAIGGPAFLYMRARVQGRRAAAATTRAITTGMARASSTPEQAQVTPPDDATVLDPAAATSFSSSQALDRYDDVPEFPLPDDATELTPTGEDPAATIIEELPPTLAVPAEPQAPIEGATMAQSTVLPSAGAMPAAPADLPPTEAVPAAEDAGLPPTEVVPTRPQDDLPPTESLPSAAQPADERRIDQGSEQQD
jgi:eukaryotic-like serine/threonine-protein kinase